MEESTYIFGYGSLVDKARLEAFFEREFNETEFKLDYLKGFKRVWNMCLCNNGPCVYQRLDNNEIYEDFHTPLNIEESENNNLLNGVVIKVNSKELEILDYRERYYDKLDITDKLSNQYNGRVYVYIAKKEYTDGYENNKDRIVISKNYFNLVNNAFKSLGDQEYNIYLDSTSNPEVPIDNIDRIEI